MTGQATVIHFDFYDYGPCYEPDPKKRGDHYYKDHSMDVSDVTCPKCLKWLGADKPNPTLADAKKMLEASGSRFHVSRWPLAEPGSNKWILEVFAPDGGMHNDLVIGSYEVYPDDASIATHIFRCMAWIEMGRKRNAERAHQSKWTKIFRRWGRGRK